MKVCDSKYGRTEYLPVRCVCTDTMNDRERELSFGQILGETLVVGVLSPDVSACADIDRMKVKNLSTL